MNAVDAGRRLARRMLGLQLVAVLVTALLWWVSGPRSALSALIGGLGLALGTAATAWGAFGGGVTGGGERLARLLLGIAGKWLVVAVALYVAIGALKLPAVPALVGAAVAALALVMAGKSETRVRA